MKKLLRPQGTAQTKGMGEQLFEWSEQQTQMPPPSLHPVILARRAVVMGSRSLMYVDTTWTEDRRASIRAAGPRELKTPTASRIPDNRKGKQEPATQ